MPKVEKISIESARMSMLIYGHPGTGKTPFAASAPRTLILECDSGGDVSAAVSGTSAEKITIDDWQDMTEAYEWLRHEGCQHYDWVWIDSLTLFQEKGLASIMRDVKAAKPHRNQYVPDRPEYGENMNRVSALIRDLKALPINLGATAHILREEDPDTNEIMYMPYIQGKNMPQKVCGWFAIVGFMDIAPIRGQEDKGPQQYLLLKTDGRHYARDRFSLVPQARIVNPTVPKLMNLVSSNKPARPVRKTAKKAAR